MSPDRPVPTRINVIKRLLCLIVFVPALPACSDDAGPVAPGSDTGITSDATDDAADADTGSVADVGSSDVADGAADAPTDADVGADAEPEVVTWTNFAEVFFADFCVSCHSPAGRASADFREYGVVTQRLNAIRCGVAPELRDGCEGEHPPGWFPIGSGPMPTDEERWTLVEWIENGAPE